MSLTIHHIVFAALMHDIGKVVQRSGAADVPKYSEKCRQDPKTKVLGYKHAMWTADFLARHPLSLPEQEWDSIVELAGSHHCKDSWKLHNYDKYLDIIMQADHISSSWDREESEDSSGDKQRYLKMPLYSVFSALSPETKNSELEKESWHYPLQKISSKSAFPVQSNELRNQSAEYKSLLSDFEDDYSKLCNYYNDLATSSKNFEGEHFPQFIDAVDNLLKKYFWCVPANTMEAHPVGSLYHHMKNCASISAALYTKHHSAEPSIEPPFTIVAADMNGIQTYLYDLNPENSAKASKLLRARSFQIQMILEMAAHKVVSELGLSHQSIILDHGGKWFILANNSQANETKLQELKTLIYREMYTRYLGTVSMNITWSIKLGLYDLNKQHFLDSMIQCHDSLEEEKLARFSTALQENGKWKSKKAIINSDNIFHDELCDFCKRRKGDSSALGIYQKYESQGDEEVRICGSCLNEIRLGRNLALKHFFKIWPGENTDNSYIHFAGMNFGSAPEPELAHLQAGEYYFSVQDNHEQIHIPHRYLARKVPIKDDRVCTFEEIAEQNMGIKANAIMKGDVDNLGFLMNRAWPQDDKGEVHCSITEYSTLSFLMDYFFSALLPQLVAEKYNDSIYTVYSGGDDFCLIGAYEKVIDLAEELRNKFTAYCANNPFLHFSAAITMMHPKEPVKFAILATDDRLDAAKDMKGKNRLHLYETIVGWEDMHSLMEFSAFLDKWKEKGDITLQFLYRLLAYHEMYLETKNKHNTNYRNFMYQSLLHYDIKRNIEKGRADNLTNAELVKTLKNLTGLEEGNMMKHLRIPLCHTIYKDRNSIKE